MRPLADMADDDTGEHMKALLHTTAPVAYASAGITPDQVAMAREARDRVMTFDTDPMLRRSPDNAAMLSYWDKVDTLMGGIEALRLAGQLYLPKFNDEEQTDYDFRLSCTKITNIYQDIVEGLAGKPFAEPITLIKGQNEEEEPPQSIQDFVQDVDGSGNTLTTFASETFFNGINNAIDWIYVDFPKPDPTIRTRADAIRAGIRPYWSHVLARNVLEVQSRVINGEETLTYMRIFEPGEKDHVRVFRRHEDGTVTWELYQKADRKIPDSDTQFVRVDGGDISIGKIPLVPLITGRRMGRTWKIRPPMQAAADLQIELYQQESDLKYAKKLTAFPMLAANGIAPPKDASGKENKNIRVGPNRVLWSTPNSASGQIGTWKYVEPNAQSLEFLAKDIKDGQQALRDLGRQPLTANSENITVITASVAAGKVKSAVKAWALMLKNAIEEALLMTADWLGIEYDPLVYVFIDFDDYTDGEDVDALLTMREKGDISRETLHEEMKRRTILSSNFTVEREQRRLLMELPGDPGEDG